MWFCCGGTAGWDPKGRCVYSPGIPPTAPPLAAAGLVVPNPSQLVPVCAPVTQLLLEASLGLLEGLLVCWLLPHSDCDGLTTSFVLGSNLQLLGCFCGTFSWQSSGNEKCLGGWKPLELRQRTSGNFGCICIAPGQAVPAG